MPAAARRRRASTRCWETAIRRRCGADRTPQQSGLQSAFNTLGLAEADWVAAQRLPNPGFSIGRLTQGSEVEWERSLHLNLARLLTMPMRADIEQRLFEQTRRELVLEVLRLAAETRKAWVLAVAATQTAQYQQQAMEAAEAGAELARRMAQVGNWSKLKQAREQSFYADAALAVARAEQAKGQTRERLVRLMGLPGVDRLQLPVRLPDLPAAIPSLPDVEQQAMASRIDLQMTRLQTEALAKNLGLRAARASSTCWSSASSTTVRTRSRNSAATKLASSCRCSTGADSRGAGRIALSPGAGARTRNRGQRALGSA